MARTTSITVVSGDVLGTDCDVLVLKYAQGPHGLDYAIAEPLGLTERDFSGLSVGRHLLIRTGGRLRARAVLYLGVPGPLEFSSADARECARESLRILAGQDCEKANVATTMYGSGLWLDEREAFGAQIAGMREYLKAPTNGWVPDKLAIWERDGNRAGRLTELLESLELGGSVATVEAGDGMTPEEAPKTTGREAPPATVFISHASEDSALAAEVCRILEGDGIRCWIAPRDVEPGRPFSEGILDGIESTRVMVLLLSGHANQSAFVNKEVERAISKGKVVIPLRIQDVQPSRALELFISSTQWIDAWAPPLESRVHVLAAAIRGLLYLPPLQGNEPAPVTPVPAAVVPTPVPAPVTPVAQVKAAPRERRLPVSRRVAGLSIAGLVAAVACVVLVAGLLFGSHAGGRTRGPSSAPSTATSSSHGIPVVSSVDLRQDTSTGQLVVYQDVHFSDSDGDVYRWDFRIAGSTIPGAQSQGGELNIPSAFQKSGAVATAEWLCGTGGYSMPLQVTFTDRANHQSVPYEYTLDCVATG